MRDIQMRLKRNLPDSVSAIGDNPSVEYHFAVASLPISHCHLMSLPSPCQSNSTATGG